MKRTESKFVARDAMLAHLADGWRLADPPEIMEGGGETRFLVVRDVPVPALVSALSGMAKAARALLRGAAA